MLKSPLRTALLPLLLLGVAYAAEDPKPEAILDKALEATGGREAYDKVKNEVATGTLELPAMSISGALTSYRAAPNKSYTMIDLGAAGTAEEGSNGEIAWSINGMEGARIKDGDERAIALRNDAFHVETRWRDFYSKVELAGSEDVGGKPCYKLVLTPKDGGSETRYYDKSSNLLVKIILPVHTAEGSAIAELSLADYKSEGGILMAHTITQKLPNLEVVVKITGVKQNQEIPANRFDLPAEIKALVKK